MIAMAKAPTMVIIALVLSLLALPAFCVRREGLERISFLSQPLNSLDHRPAGLIEVEAGTGERETEEDECDKELRSLEKTFTETCARHAAGATRVECRTQAKNTIEHMVLYEWQGDLASKVLKAGKTPVFWAGFWPGGEEGIDTRQALANFISSVKGFQLANTEWGQAAESKGANNLEACDWPRKKNWWNAASISMAKAMALHNVPNIIIALHKTLHGKYSFYKTVLYRAELMYMGAKMRGQSTWNPQFEVRSIAVKGAPRDASGCALASEVKYQLERKAERSVTVWCRPCTTLQRCGPKQQVEKKSPKAECIGNCRNGQGTRTWADGEIYQGGWKNDLKEGQGTKTYASGAKYQGEYKNGLKDGQGTYTYANGEKYQGQWKNDKQDGQGTKTFADGSMYQGQWENGTMDGQGTFTSAHGSMYKGGWKNDNMDGQGTATWANGEIYQGGWKNDLKEGQGTKTYANGDQYQGEYKNGLKDGQGTYTYADGDQYKVWYKEGRLMKEVEKKWWWW